MLTRPAVALECILNQISPLSGESLPLMKARGRYLLRAVLSPISLPPFDGSAMDGFALRASDSLKASSSSPLSFEIVDTLAAGSSSQRALQTREAVRIMTGAPLPPGADTVLPFEETQEKEGKCWLHKALNTGKHVRKKGEDVEQGNFLLNAGVKLNPQNMALLAALGMSEIFVTRRPKIALFSTGDELRPLGTPLELGQIYDSNAPTLTFALNELGLDAQGLPTPKDTLEDLEQAFQRASEADVILSMGAVSAGDFDLIPQVLKKIGAEIVFHKLAIKPGKPLLFARWKQRYIFCLPGNPVSALVVFDRFVRPALLKMMGASSLFRRRYTAIASEALKATAEKEDYLRARVTWKEGSFFARLSGAQGSAQLNSLAESNALIIIPESVAQVSEGEKVEFEFWGEA